MPELEQVPISLPGWPRRTLPLKSLTYPMLMQELLPLV